MINSNCSEHEVTKECILHFVRNTTLIEDKIKPKKIKKWTEERKMNKSIEIRDKINRKENYQIISPLKSNTNR